MISVSTWLLYFHVLGISNVRCVRIFEVEKTFPPAPPDKFVAEVTKKSCLLIPQHGPCRANIPMYYFNPDLSNCSTFDWGGCQGNGNRHETYEGCMSYCLRAEDAGKIRPLWCSLSFDYGYCFGSVVRYYFDNLWKVCKKTIYSGCGGNRNNFYSKAQCDQVCLYGNGPIALTTLDPMATAKKYIIVNPESTTVAGQAENPSPSK